MSINELLNTIADFFDSKKKEQGRQIKNLKIILAKLKMQSKMLRKNISDESDSNKRKQMQREYYIVCAQRNKAIKLLKSLEGTVRQPRRVKTLSRIEMTAS